MLMSTAWYTSTYEGEAAGTGEDAFGGSGGPIDMSTGLVLATHISRKSRLRGAASRHDTAHCC